MIQYTPLPTNFDEIYDRKDAEEYLRRLVTSAPYTEWSNFVDNNFKASGLGYNGTATFPSLNQRTTL